MLKCCVCAYAMHGLARLNPRPRQQQMRQRDSDSVQRFCSVGRPLIPVDSFRHSWGLLRVALFEPFISQLPQNSIAPLLRRASRTPSIHRQIAADTYLSRLPVTSLGTGCQQNGLWNRCGDSESPRRSSLVLVLHEGQPPSS